MGRLCPPKCVGRLEGQRGAGAAPMPQALPGCGAHVWCWPSRHRCRAVSDRALGAVQAGRPSPGLGKKGCLPALQFALGTQRPPPAVYVSGICGRRAKVRSVVPEAGAETGKPLRHHMCTRRSCS